MASGAPMNVEARKKLERRNDKFTIQNFVFLIRV